MAILGGGPLSSVPISGLEGAAAAPNDDRVQAVFNDDGLYVDSDADATTDYFQGVQGSPLENAPPIIDDISGTIFIDPVWIIDDEEWTPDWSQAPPKDITDALAGDLILSISNEFFVDEDEPVVGSFTGIQAAPPDQCSYPDYGARGTQFPDAWGPSNTINLPTVVSGSENRYIVIYGDVDSGGDTLQPPPGWTKMYGAKSGNLYCGVLWRDRDGTEGTTIETTGNSVVSATYLLQNCDLAYAPEMGAAATGTGVSADMLSLSPSWGAAETRWFVGCTQNVADTSAPDGTWEGGSFNSTLSAYTKIDSSASLDPAAMTVTPSALWGGFTLAVKGHCGGPYNFETSISSKELNSADETRIEEDFDFQGIQARGTPISDELGETTGRTFLPDGSELTLEWDEFDFQGIQAAPPDQCSYPDYGARAPDYPKTTGSSNTINLPPPVTGSENRYIAILGQTSGRDSTVAPAGWTKISGALNGNLWISVLWRDRDGTEGTTATTTGGTHIAGCYLLQNCDLSKAPEISAPASGTSTLADALNLTPSWGSAETMWFSACTVATTTIAAPAGYVDGTSINNVIGVFTKQVLQASEDPGTMSLGASVAWAAITIAVKGHCGGPYNYETSISSKELSSADETRIEEDFDLQGSQATSLEDTPTPTDDVILQVSFVVPDDDDEPLTDGLYHSPLEDVAPGEPSVFVPSVVVPDDDDEYTDTGFTSGPLEDAPLVAGTEFLGTSTVVPDDDDEPLTDGHALGPLEDAHEPSIINASFVVPDDDDEPLTEGLYRSPPDQDDQYNKPCFETDVFEAEELADGTYSSPLENAPDVSILGTSTVVPDDDDEYIDFGFVASIYANADAFVAVTGISINVLLGCYHVYGFAAISDGSSSWAAVSQASNSWSMVSDGSTSWTPASGANGSWVMMPDGSTVWTDEC